MITASAQPFTDISAVAGLTKPIIYGGVDAKKFIIETNGCGVAFYDYDKDGWMDILTLSGSKLEGAPKEATNRLYKNNRNGTFTDVTAKAGLIRSGWASALTIGDFDNDGWDDLFITYWGRMFFTITTETEPSQTSQKNPNSILKGFAGVRAAHFLIMIAMENWIYSFPII